VGELHIVHYNDRYRSIIEAGQHQDGLAVLAILIEMGPRDNEAFNHIVDHFPQILNDGEETNLVSPIPIGQLLPFNTNDFYRYKGSLVNYSLNFII
jgi:carbonic anhydrase